jgi:hypothetical protein
LAALTAATSARGGESVDTIPIDRTVDPVTFCNVPRLARIVVPGLPHHVTQRGNRRELIFFEDGDQKIYRNLLAEQTRRAGLRSGLTA